MVSVCAASVREKTISGAPAKQRRQGRRAKLARKRRAGKWNDDDRDLAERELAAVVVERQKVRSVTLRRNASSERSPAVWVPCRCCP